MSCCGDRTLYWFLLNTAQAQRYQWHGKFGITLNEAAVTRCHRRLFRTRITSAKLMLFSCYVLRGNVEISYWPDEVPSRPPGNRPDDIGPVFLASLCWLSRISSIQMVNSQIPFRLGVDCLESFPSRRCLVKISFHLCVDCSESLPSTWWLSRFPSAQMMTFDSPPSRRQRQIFSYSEILLSRRWWYCSFPSARKSSVYISLYPDKFLSRFVIVQIFLGRN